MSVQGVRLDWTVVNGQVTVTPTMVDALTPTGQLVSADAAVSIQNGNIVITKSSAAAITLAAPTATTDDYKTLKITDQSGYLHTVVTPSNKINGDSTTINFSGVVGASAHLIAYQGVWYLINVYNTFLT